ncbi:hypothetical protein SAY87_000551 [Trapa incisa]|uniref:non-specific serine/threonine protein kinase n=1 Tax=Trapa incisa TaxID=236973 RepID=A0AAN7GBV5_9MYRT|nr:hypothetical protein SAY87_000551 [Trapa incisa]
MPGLHEDECLSLAAAGRLPEEEAECLMGKYELGRLLGRGAFGKVYHAREIRTGQSVAIKAVCKQKVVKGGFTAHVKREVSIMRRLRHPNVLRLSEVLATRSKIYFVMEFAKGGELFARVARGRFSEDLCRRYFHQLISAVGHCHSRGVFHRDLKPENLLLDDNWDLKVSDFGLSAVRDQIRPDDGLLHTLCGTPAYVAPEILAKKGYDGAKVDIWSCGIILFVLSAGYLPFNDHNLMVMYRKIYQGQFRCPRWTSPELQHFLSRLLDTKPATRITIDEMHHDPWFRRGYDETKFRHHNVDFETKPMLETADGEAKCLNAFDIISFSSGFDLSGLLNDRLDGKVEADRFVSAEKPEVILKTVEEAAEEAGLRVEPGKGWGVRLEGQGGNFVAGVGIDRLTEELVVVEVKRREVEAESGRCLWKDKLRPKLLALIYQPDPPVPGG